MPSFPIFDLASLALMVASISASLNLPWLWDWVSVPPWTPSEQIKSERTTKILFMSISAWKRYNSHMNQNEIARRSFLTATAITAASYSRVLGANDTIQLGVIGAGDR